MIKEKNRLDLMDLVIFIFIALGIFMLLGAIEASKYDLYGIFMMFINVPLGILLLILSIIAKKTESRDDWKRFIPTIGMIIGLATILVPFVLHELWLVQ